LRLPSFVEEIDGMYGRRLFSSNLDARRFLSAALDQTGRDKHRSLSQKAHNPGRTKFPADPKAFRASVAHVENSSRAGSPNEKASPSVASAHDRLLLSLTDLM